MKSTHLLLGALLLPGLAYAWPWSQDMMNQPSVKPEEPISPKAIEMMPFPAHSVPVQGYPTKVADIAEAQTLTSPLPVTEEGLKKGKTLFRIICAACHGLTGRTDSPVAAKIGAIDLTSDYVQKQLTEGWIFGTITFGSASTLMPPYGVTAGGVGSNDLSPQERWLVVNYVKHRLAQEPPEPDAPPPVQKTASK